MTDVRSGGKDAWLGDMPRAHVTSRTNRLLCIIDRRQSLRILLGDIFEYTHKALPVRKAHRLAPALLVRFVE